MNPEHEMLADKIKGHTYKLTLFQYAEVRQHMDAEMMYIVSEKVSMFREKVVQTPTKRYVLYDLFKVITNEVFDVMRERENYKGKLLPDRAITKMLKALDTVGTEDNMQANAETYMIYAVADALTQIRYHEA